MLSKWQISVLCSRSQGDAVSQLDRYLALCYAMVSPNKKFFTLCHIVFCDFIPHYTTLYYATLLSLRCIVLMRAIQFKACAVHQYSLTRCIACAMQWNHSKVQQVYVVLHMNEERLVITSSSRRIWVRTTAVPPSALAFSKAVGRMSKNCVCDGVEWKKLGGVRYAVMKG